MGKLTLTRHTNPGANVGMATGSHSGIDVVDLDGPIAQDRFATLFGMPETIMQKTGRADGGVHIWFKHNGHQLRNATGKEENKGIDFKTTGGIAVVAPSVHATGNPITQLVTWRSLFG